MNDLIAAHESGEKPAMDNIIADLRKGAAHFIKAGIELDLEQ